MPTSRARTGLVVLAIGMATAVTFAPALRNGFIDLDDQANLVDNFRFRGLGPSELRWMFTTFHLGHWQPLSWITLALDHAVWGMNPAGYHLTSIGWHAANAALVFLLARRLLADAGVGASRIDAAAAVGALLWAVHPLRVESVAWVTERRDVLSGFFALLAVLVYVGRRGSGPTVVLLMALSLLAKASAMVLPAVLIVLDVYPLRRLGGEAGRASPRARRVWLEKLPLLALAAVAGGLALAAQRSAGALRPLGAVPPGARLGAAMLQPGFYLWKTLLPVNLLPVYEYPLDMSPLQPLAVAGALTLAVLAGLAWWQRARWPALGAILAAYVAILGPTLGLAQSGPQVAADRYTYLAMIGWSVGAGAVVTAAPWPRMRLRLVATVPVILLLAALAGMQTTTWHDPRTMWTRAVRLAPDNTFAQYRLADAEQRAGDRDGAIRRLRAALAARPVFAEAQSDLGALLAASGQIDEALVHYDAAVRANPRFAFAYTSLGVTLAAVGRTDEALAAHRKALAIDPDLMEAHANLGTLLDEQGHTDAAMAEYETALRLRPSAEVLNDIGVLLSNRGRPVEAAARYRAAAELRPELAAIRVNLAYALRASGDRAGARQALEEALRLEPGNAQARTALDGLGAP